MRTRKKFLSILLTLALLLSLLPTTALADGENEEAVSEEPTPEEQTTEGLLTAEMPAYMVFQDFEPQPTISMWSMRAPSWSDASFRSDIYEGYYAQLDADSQNYYDQMKSGFSDSTISSVNITINKTFENCTGSVSEGVLTLDDTSKAEISGWITANLFTAYLALERDHPEMPWLVANSYGTGSFSMSPVANSDGTYNVTISTLPFQLTGVPTFDASAFTSSGAFTTAVNEAVNALNADSGTYDIDAAGKTTYDKVKGIHDYVCDMITYNATSSAPFNQTSYSAFVSPHGTVCAGYATSFKVLCDKYDIPCVYVSGRGGVTSPEAHGWNYVLMDDGNWYAVDCTWDDQSTIRYDFFLSGSTTTAGTGWADTGMNNSAFSVNHQSSGNWIADSLITFPYPALNDTAYVHKTALTGTPTISGTVTVGQTLTAVVTDLSDQTNITYQWCADGTDIPHANGSTYTLAPADANKKISVKVTATSASAFTGTVTSAESNAVANASQTAPSITDSDITKADTTITVTANDAWEYSKDGGVNWQPGNVFTELSPSTTYQICVRLKAKTGYNESEKSNVISVTTNTSQIPDSAKGTLAGYNGTYDKAAHDAVIGAPADGYTVTAYSTTSATDGFSNTMPTVTNAGTTSVWVKLSRSHYDDKVFELTATVTAKDINSETITQSGALTYTGVDQSPSWSTSLTAFDYTLTGNSQSNAGTHQATFTGKGNYTGTKTVDWTIGEAPLTMTATVDSKAYDGNTSATINPGTLTGVLNSDDVHVSEASISGTFDNAFAGSGKTVTANTNFSLTGEKAGNYTLTQPTGLTGTITAATQTLTSSYTTEATAKQLTKGLSVDLLELVGTNAPAKTGISFAINSGAPATLDGTTLTASSSTSGTVTVTVKGAAYDAGGDASPEYSAAEDITIYVKVVDKPTHSLAVTQQNGTYGTELPDPVYTPPVGTTNTTIIYSTGLSSKPTAVGNGYTVTVTCETPEYIYTGTSNTFSIGKRWLYPSLTGSVTKVYDGNTTITAAGSLAISLDGLNGLVGIVGSDDVRVSSATFTFNDSNVGDDKQVNANDITLAGAQKDNYQLYVSTCSANVGKITKSTPTIAFNGYTPSKTYDGTPLANPTSSQLTIAGASYENVTFTWYKDSVSEGNKLTAAPKDAGTYVVVASIPATANTAAASVTSGTITISAKPVSTPTITLSQSSYTYDGTEKKPTVTVKDDETIISEDEYTVDYTNNTDVGTAKVTITDKTGGNYTVSGAAEFTITTADQAALRITSAATVTYGETLTLTTEGGTGSGAVTFSVETGGTGAATISDNTKLTPNTAGTVNIKATKAGGTNYNDVTATATITINKADPNVGTVSVSYSGTIYASTTLGTITLTKDGSAAGTLALDAGQTLTVGDHAYNWTFTPADTTNYNTATGTVVLHVAEDTLSSIAVTGTPTKTAYKFGEPFETAGLTVTATYASTNTKDVTANVTFDALAVGQTEITLSYTEGSVTKTCTVNGITVSKAAAPAVSGVARTFVRTSATSGNTVSIASLLPANRGTTTYAVTSTTYAALESVSVSADGTLTFGTKAMGSEVTDTITVKAVMQNYEDATATVTVKLISKTPVTITGVTAEDGTYDGSAHSGYSGTPTSSSYTGTYTVTYTGRAGTVYNSTAAPVNAGSYTVTFRVPDSDPTYAGSAELDFTIAKATITITAGSKNAYVGDAVPTLDSSDCTVAGLVGEDVLAAAPTVAYASTPDMTKAGTVAIKASGAVVPAGGNYEDEITYVDGTLTISSRPYYGGGSSSSNTTTSTTTNKDGSTTTTTTNKTTGTVTEVTKDKDGTTTTVETKKDGTVTETVKTTNGTTGTVVTDKDGNVTEAKANVSTAAAKEAGKTGEAVTLPVEVPAAKTTEDAPAVQVTVPKASGSVKVEIPVEKVTPGTVAVIVNADGTEKIVSTSVTTENGVALTILGAETVKIIDNSKSFTDVPKSNVFYNEIASLSAREIMVGKTDGKFDLHNSVTLNQIANVAGRIVGAVDVKDYNAGIAWGAEYGLKTGNVAATRGDVLKALYIAAGSPIVADTSVLTRFNDAGSIPADLMAAAAWAAQNGILKGNVDGSAGLGNNVTRGQACALAGRTMGTLA